METANTGKLSGGHDCRDRLETDRRFDLSLGPRVDGSGLSRVSRDVSSGGRCSHVSGLCAARTLAIMPSADLVPVKSAHSTVRWPEWVVLITGSTRSALRAVGPLQPFVSRHDGAILSVPLLRRASFSPHAATWRVRRAPCRSRLWPSSPMPFGRSCWPARSWRLLSACARVAWSATADA